MADEEEKERRKFAKDFLEKWAKAERTERPVEEVIAEIDDALARAPDDPTLWFRKGLLLSELEKWELALLSLRRAESLDPNLPRLQAFLLFVLSHVDVEDDSRKEPTTVPEEDVPPPPPEGPSVEEVLRSLTGPVSEARDTKVDEELKSLTEELRKVKEAEDAEELRALKEETIGPATRATVDEALKSLSEDLRQVAESAAEEKKAVRELEELAPLTGAEETEQKPENRIKAWEAAGLDVGPLREIQRQDPDRLGTAILQFEQSVRKVQVLEDTVKSLDPRGLEPDIERVRSLFRSPYQIWRIEAEMATLLEKVDARNGTARGRTVLPPARRPGQISRPEPAVRPKPEGKVETRGAINGLGTGRVNGLAPGRVNGLAPGRVNGLGTGRVNGVGTGRVNGLVNGLQRARSGITNGITNGLGLTNGLGGRRFLGEVRARRWRLFFVPFTAVLLLSVPFFLPGEEPVSGIDGDRRDWPEGYRRTPSLSNRHVDLTEFDARLQNDRITVLALVNGTWFADPADLDMFFLFIDSDGDAETGYDEGRVGAELLIEISGGDGGIQHLGAKSWTGVDRDNWTAWRGAGLPLLVASKGPVLELELDMTDFAPYDENKASLMIHTDDQEGARAASPFAFGKEFGALVVEAEATNPVNQTTDAPFVTLTFRAFGPSWGVRVDDVTFRHGPTTPVLTALFPPFPFALGGSETREVTFAVDGSGISGHTMLSAELLHVTANRTVTLIGGPLRAYVGASPPGLAIDGLFDEWTSTGGDLDPASNPDVDIVEFSSEGQGETAFVFMEVRGTILGGHVAPRGHHRARPSAAGPSVPPPAPQRLAGEDMVRVYFDALPTTEGFAVEDIVADTILQIRGRYGEVRSLSSYVWGGEWSPNGTPAAVSVGSKLEASLHLEGVVFPGVEFVIEARDWRADADRTDATRTRGTRSGPNGVTVTGEYSATFPHSADGAVTFEVRNSGSVSWRLPEFRVIHDQEESLLALPTQASANAGHSEVTYGGAYDGLEASVRYRAEGSRLKEEVTLLAPPPIGVQDMLVLATPIIADASLLVQVTGNASPGGLVVDGDFVLTDGYGFSITMQAPWALDASGRRVDLAYRWRDRVLAILVPGTWLAGSDYPVLVDPTATYQFENDGPSEDVGESLGYSVSMGDFNADGYADLLTGAPFNNLDGINYGYAYVFYGPLSSNDATPDVRIRGTSTGARHGFSVAAGRFNGDAYWDALVSSVSFSGFMGNVSIYYGSATWSGLEQTPDVNFTWPLGPRNFGHWVAAGNIDNANEDDVLIGEHGRDNDGGLLTSDGAVHVFMSPFLPIEALADFVLKPSTNGNGQFGYSFAVGKIDSDAYADVVVGEPFVSSNNGRVHFFKGSNMTLGFGDRLPNAVLTAPSSGEKFGQALAAGLINGDAYADVLVGAPGKTVGGTANTGVAHVFLANSNGTGLTTGASPTATLSNQTAGEQFGTAVLVADYDDDGSGGAVVGAPNADPGGPDRGSAYWFDSPTTDQTVDDTVNGTQNNELMGSSLAAARFGSDPRTRVAVGAYRWDDNASNPTDNDGRVLLAEVPELPAILIPLALATVLFSSRNRRRKVGKR